MKYAAIIQARSASTRLPRKVLQDLEGKPVLQRVIERAQRSCKMDEVLVVTSIEREDLAIQELCAQLGVRVFAGSEEDVLDRYYQLAKLVQPQYIVRITADCPFYDWTVLDDAVETMEEKSDYLSDFGETLPDGLDVEIFRFSALKDAWQNARMQSEREHLTQYIRNNPQRFVLQNYANPLGSQGHLRWTLDEPEDYRMIQAVYRHFLAQGREDFLQGDILAYLGEHEEVQRMNSAFARNEGLAKSLEEDREATIL